MGYIIYYMSVGYNYYVKDIGIYRDILYVSGNKGGLYSKCNLLIPHAHVMSSYPILY